MTFTEQAVAATKDTFEGILAQPFLQELAAGSLATKRFVQYMQQDALYLGQYARVLLLLASKAPTTEAMLALADFGKGAVLVERQLHDQFLATYQAPPATEMGAACLAYTSFLTTTVATKPYAIGLASILPCFKVYTDVGHQLLCMAKTPNPYQAWLDTYAAPEFDALTAQACAMADATFTSASLAEQAEMLVTYQNGAKLEAWFWEDAYEPSRTFLL